MSTYTKLMTVCSAAVFTLGLAACGGANKAGDMPGAKDTDETTEVTPMPGPTTPKPTVPRPTAPEPEVEMTPLEEALDLVGRLEDIDLAMSLTDAVKYAGMLTSESVNGDSAMAIANAQLVLDANQDIMKAVTDANAVLAEVATAMMAAENIENDAERAAVMRFLEDAKEAAEMLKMAAMEITRTTDPKTSGVADVDTLAEAVTAVKNADEMGTPADAGKAVAMAVMTAFATAVTEGEVTDLPEAGGVDVNDAMDIGAEVWAKIVGEENVMDVRRLTGGPVKAMSVMGSMAADLAATGVAAPTSTTGDKDDDDMYDASYMGIDGTVFCAGADCDVSETGALTGSWYFTPDSLEVLFVADEDGMYGMANMYTRYGYWLTYTNRNATGVSTFAVTSANTDNLDLGQEGEGAEAMDMEATYSGSAIGISAHGDASGQFTAAVDLTAKFADTATLRGTISKFEGAAVNTAWTVGLDETDLDANDASLTGTVFGDATDGAWTAQGYGPEQEGVGDDAVDSRPTGFFGRFNADFTDGRAAGAYATRADE